MFCTSCGSLVSPTSDVCPVCDRALPVAFGRKKTNGRPRRFAHLLLALVPLFALAAFAGFGANLWQANQHERDAAYEQADAELAAGDFDAAELGFGALGGYRDSSKRLDEVQAVADPVRQALDAATATFDSGDYASGVAMLEQVVRSAPGYAPAADQLAASQAAWIEQLHRDAASATANRDWLAAELALRQLNGLQPDDADIESQLADMVRQHAPVVFVRDGAVFLDGPNGGQEDALTRPLGAVYPSWSPDRSKIAFIATMEGERRFNGTLMIMKGDGSDLRAVAYDVLPYSWPVWSPDGARLAFSSIANFDTKTFTGAIALHVYDVGTGDEIDLTGGQLPHAAIPTWAPDGSLIAFVSNTIERRSGGGIDLRDGDIYVVPSAGGSVRNLTQNRIRDEWWVQWSPAGNRMLIFTAPGDWASPALSELYLLGLDTDELTEIPIGEWQTSLPFWSPDGARIAYVTGGDTVNIWSDTGLQWVQLGGEVSSFATWSPDGRYLLTPPVDNSHPGYVVDVADRFGTITPFELDYDSMSGSNGLPVWGSITPPNDD
jgi:Tol biopolymer transport system component